MNVSKKLRELRDRLNRSAFARRMWPQPLSGAQGELVGIAMARTMEPIAGRMRRRRRK